MDDSEAPVVNGVRGSHLAWVTMTHRSAEAAVLNRSQAIERARAFGVTWEELGAAMGMTRQAAHKRFGGVDGRSNAGGHEPAGVELT